MKVVLAVLFFSAAILSIQSCTSNEIGNSKDVNPETVFVSYNVSYTDGTDSLECTAQFRFAGKNGTTLVLTDPSVIRLDGKKLAVDSTEFDGAFYRYTSKPDAFSGNHEWEYTDINNKTYKESFSFQPICFLTSLPATISKKDLEFKWQNGTAGQMLRLEITDTASATPDIRHTLDASANHILITAAELKSLDNGPLYIKFLVETEKPLKNTPREGGTFTFNYMVKQFEVTLAD